MELKIVDTSSLGTFSFYIHAQMAGVSSVNQVSALTQITVVCGTESVITSVSERTISPSYPLLTSGASSSITGVISDFSSSKTQCPVTSLQLCNDASCSSLFSQPTKLQLVNSGSVSSSSIKVHTDLPHKT
jgi:hypothetical protein